MALQDHDTSADRVPSNFDQRWRERFAEFATIREDDAGIAGWSASGLETRFRCFRRAWHSVPSGSLYLDVGCGAATYTRWLAEQGLDVVGIDYSLPTLIKARERTPASIPLCGGDAKRLPFATGSFDGALCFGLLQAASESAPVVQELSRILKPGANLWIDALNGAGIAGRLARIRRRVRGKVMHLRYESPARLAAILQDTGFINVRTHWLPMVPAPFARFQPVFESQLARAMLVALYPVGLIVSHSFLLSATRGPSIESGSHAQ